MLQFKSFLDEGKNDPAIFKVIFMAGGPGSGKSTIAHMLGLHALGFVSINSDAAFEQGLKKSLLSLKMPEGEEYARNIVRGLAKKTTKRKQGHAVEGRLGMVIDGTGKDLGKIKRQVKSLEQLGYEASMVFVDTTLDAALERNEERDRSLNPKMVTSQWKGVQKNKGSFKKLFGNRLWVIDNTNYEVSGIQTNKVYTKIMSWAKDLPDNPAVKHWMET